MCPEPHPPLMAQREVGGKTPKVAPGAYVDDSALLIGDVSLGARASVWPCALMRADDDSIEVGDGSAIMDMAFLEAPKGRPVKVGDRCLISHGARLHGCVVEDDCLIGIGAIVLDGAKVGRGSIVAAGSLVPPGRDIPARSVVAGTPATVVRQASAADAEMISGELETVGTKAARYASGADVR